MVKRSDNLATNKVLTTNTPAFIPFRKGNCCKKCANPSKKGNFLKKELKSLTCLHTLSAFSFEKTTLVSSASFGTWTWTWSVYSFYGRPPWFGPLLASFAPGLGERTLSTGRPGGSLPSVDHPGVGLSWHRCLGWAHISTYSHSFSSYHTFLLRQRTINFGNTGCNFFCINIEDNVDETPDGFWPSFPHYLQVKQYVWIINEDRPISYQKNRILWRGEWSLARKKPY